MDAELENRMDDFCLFGCDMEEFRKSVVESDDFVVGGAKAVAVSLMSDAQEEMDSLFRRDARHTLNRAKWVLMNL